MREVYEGCNMFHEELGDNILPNVCVQVDNMTKRTFIH